MSSEKAYVWPKFTQKPSHLAVILDGNGRWAKQQNKGRIHGHIEGQKAVKRLVQYTMQLKIPYLSIYAFSTENWQRDPKEVSFIIKLIFTALKTELNELHKQKIKIKFINLPLDSSLKHYHTAIQEAEEKTKNNEALTLQIMFNYGSKQHILHTFNQFTKKPVSIEAFEEKLCQGVPFPDIMIRTGGKQRARLSNFMLWELAYSELFFLDTLWPDFNAQDLENILREYESITRNFGNAS